MTEVECDVPPVVKNVLIIAEYPVPATVEYRQVAFSSVATVSVV
jgi:hypothetical protein